MYEPRELFYSRWSPENEDPRDEDEIWEDEATEDAYNDMEVDRYMEDLD